MTRNFIYAAILTVLIAFSAFGQKPTPSPTPPKTETILITDGVSGLPRQQNVLPVGMILTGADKQRQNYREEFKNLLAEEKKTFETYDKNGALKKQTIVESTLLVYQSPKDKTISSELRNVLRVDGKTLPDSQQRSEELFAELGKTSTIERELEKIQSEGSRYDKTLEITGLTVSEAVVLSDNLRPYFDFKLAGNENYQGNDVYVVSYQQTKKSPNILVNGDSKSLNGPGFNFKLSVPGSLKKEDAFLRGKLWIDAKTLQIWREERELTVGTSNPVVLLATTLEYQPSDYGILVPKQISVLSNDIKKDSNQYMAVKDTRVNFDYSKFRKTETDVKILDDDK
jgi:hypothetical protein